MNVYIDLDGTLIDVFERYGGIFNLYIQRYGYQIPINEYKKMRQSGFSDTMILRQKFQIDISDTDFPKFKRCLLEDRKWLEKDTVIGNPNILKEYKCNFILITQRYNKSEAFHQIERLGLCKLFNKIVVLKPIYNGNSKYEYLRGKVEKTDCIIGDSLVELECARCLGMNGYFVKTGLFGEKIVDNEKIFLDYSECIQWILEEREEEDERGNDNAYCGQ